MGLDYSFLHKTLKDPTRRDILRQLEDGPLTYVELMNRAKITNTGRFNYHLKILADLIEKTDDGLYRLTDRGQLALQLLDKFPEKTAKDIQSLAKVNPPENKVKPRIKIPKKPLIASILVLLIGIAGLFAVSAVQTSNETLQIEWRQYLPGISGSSVIQTSDEGYLAVGQNASIGADSSPTFTNYTSLVVKTDSQGNPVWVKDFSIEDTDTRLNLAVQTSDGDYVLAGTNAVKTVYLTENADPQFGIASQQFCLIKADSQGNILWNNTYVQAKQSLGDLEAYVNGYSLQSIVQTSDGGYALVGSYTFSPPSNQYLWLVKTDASGNLQWGKTFSTGSYASTIHQTDDQGYVIIGTETSHGPSPSKYEIIKTDANGNLQWYKTYGGTDDYYNAESFYGLATDDGYVIVGSASPEGGSPNGWIVKTDTEGNMLWNKTYAYANLPSTIQSITQDNGNLMFIGAATKETKYGEFDTNSRTYTWIAQLDKLGNIQGQLAIDMGNSFANPASIIQTTDGGHVFVGVWNQAFQAATDQKFWMVKVADFQFTPSFYWLAIKLAIIITLVSIEVIIAVDTLKRKSWKNS